MTFNSYDISGGFLTIGNGTLSNGFVKGTSDPTQNSVIPKFIGSKEVKEINSWAFYTCFNLLSVKIEARLTVIHKSSFQYCQNLVSINIPSTCESIKSNAFDDCYRLKNVHFESPSHLKLIGYRGFNTCKVLEEITIPSSVTSLEEIVFSEIDVVINIHYCGKATFNSNIFSSTQKAIITVPRNGVSEFGGKATVIGAAKCLPNPRESCKNKCYSRFRTLLTFCTIILTK